ncbi:MAG: hypothetical protein NZ930_04215, partial [Candidatus Bipolaricaulota bacterium]|nr:hypothetical protein [Candidatus Bipolaricaulota bacterium]
MRKVALTLVAVAVALGLTTAAQQPQPAQPTLEIKIVPERPTVNDKITVELSGTFPNRCIPEKAEALVEFNQVTIRAINEQEFCVEGQTPWKLSVPVPQVNTDGKRLEAGPYQVVVLFSMEKDPDDYLLLGRKRFDIVGSGALGEQADQAEQALIPFFISLQHKHSSLPWVSQGRVRSNTVSSVSNRGGEGSLPATIAAAKGDVIVLRVTTVRGTKSNSDNRIVDCQGSGLRIRAVKSGADDQNRQQLEIEVEITGEAAREQLASTYASLTCLVEQVNGPDLDVSLTVVVRRYTEREQVYCDFTTLTRVRNVGKGSA